MENSAWWYAEWLKLAHALKQDRFACVFENWRSLNRPCLYAFQQIRRSFRWTRC